MNLAQRALEMNDLGRAVNLLNRYRPSAKSEGRSPKSEIQDLRGWEWRYLWNQCQSDAESVLCKTEGHVSALTVSHDGAWLAVATGDRGVTVWDLTTRRQITSLPARGHMVRAAFSPRERLLAYSDVPGYGSSQTNHNVHLWDGASGQIIKTFPLDYYCYGLGFSQDGQTLVTSAKNPNIQYSEGSITVWRVSDGTLVAKYPAHQAGVTEGAPFALAGDLSVAAHQTEDNKVRVIDLATGHELWPPQKATDDYVMALALSPDAKILASGAGMSDSVIRLWDVASGRELGRLEGHGSGINQLLFWPDGKTLASASHDQTIRLWDVANPAKGREQRILRGHKNSVYSLALLTNNTTLVSGSVDSVCLWNTSAKPRDRKRTIVPVTLGFFWFSPDSKSILAFEEYIGKTRETRPRLVRFSQDTEFQEMEQFCQFVTNVIDWACFSADSHWLATSYEGGDVGIWDLKSCIQTCQFHAHDHASPLGFSADRKKLRLVYREDNSLHEWDLETRQETRSWPPEPGQYTGAASPDGNWYLSSILNPDNKTITSLTDLNTGRTTNLIPRWYVGAVFSPDSKLFALAGWTQEVLVYETATAKQKARLSGFPFGVWSAVFSPDTKRVATANNVREPVRIWELESQEQLLTLECQGSLPSMMRLSPDGNVLGVLNEHDVLTLWRAPSWSEIAATEGPGAQTLGRVSHWLVLAPIALKPGQSGAEGLDIEQIEGEARLQPAAGATQSTRDGKLTWREVTLNADEDYAINFNELIGRETAQSVAYAVCYIRSETKQAGLQMLVGSDDQAKVYLNGKQVYRSPVARSFAADQDTVSDITLNAGWNVLVFKVVNEILGWQGSISITDAQGIPVKGIKATITQR
jgi:WD40 repeat protein